MSTYRNCYGDIIELPSIEPGRPGASAKRNRYQPNGYAWTPGTGPQGETCGTCGFLVRVPGGARKWPKCKLMEGRWTGGPGSDIRVRSPACKKWVSASGQGVPQVGEGEQ